MLEEGEKLSDLMARFPHPGRVQWIGLRSRHGGNIKVVNSAASVAGRGLEGDHRAGKQGGKRQVTLIQWEHLSVIAALCDRESVDPSLLRRNIAVMGINVSALKGSRIRVGSAVLEGTGFCHPCSRIEQNLGHGGYNAVRGHGGITAVVIEGGLIECGNVVEAVLED